MPSQVTWYNDTKTIIRQHLSGQWETTEWFEAAATAVTMARTVDYNVAIIVDYADDVDMNRVPTGLLQAITNLPKHPFTTDDNIVCIAIVGLSGKLAQADRIFQRLHQQRKSVRVATLEKALQVVAQDLAET